MRVLFLLLGWGLVGSFLWRELFLLHQLYAGLYCSKNRT
ncbi:hypothetical protein SLEP1_g42223 [Rubroshorea leprosula]|uniref:Uncharacterized protein n=1 Tax=Rubroshorea leprosula TaxID=152421 RepID=A0AAV5L942_9ROSI|nr:hypothetical protein SLEP1_g42223 [Rubroshorea leprosula]